MHTPTHTEIGCGRCGKRASVVWQTGGIERLSAGGYRQTLPHWGSVAARNARGIHSSNGRTGTSERVEQLMGRLPERTPVRRTLSFPHATGRRRRNVLPWYRSDVTEVHLPRRMRHKPVWTTTVPTSWRFFQLIHSILICFLIFVHFCRWNSVVVVPNLSRQ